MPKFADIYKTTSTTSETRIEKDVLLFASMLHLSVNGAMEINELYKKHGNGKIYTPRGYVFADSEATRNRVLALYGCAVAVNERGRFVYLSKYKNKEIRIKAQRYAEQKARALEYNAVMAEVRTYTTDKKREIMFKDAQTKPQPKRQGQGKNPGDIGRYVNKRRSFSVDEYTAALSRLAEHNMSMQKA